MTEPRYTIRLRYAGRRGCTALIVENARGDAFIYTRRGLACRLTGHFRLAAYTSTLHRLGWVPVPAVAPYTLDALGRLVGLIAA